MILRNVVNRLRAGPCRPKFVVLEKSGRNEIEGEIIEERSNWQQTREGVCRLRTNLSANDPERPWKNYIQQKLKPRTAACRDFRDMLASRPLGRT